jgi:hypothetical protein
VFFKKIKIKRQATKTKAAGIKKGWPAKLK